MLNGNGVPAPYTPGCVPTLFNDFIDTNSWHYRRLEPRDCAIVNISTPVFSWKQTSDRDLSQPWTFKLRNSSGGMVASRSSAAPRLVLAGTALTPGKYTWTVSYRSKSGKTVVSAERRFSVSTSSVGITVPSAASIANIAISKPHPRALPAGASFASILASAVSGEYSASIAAYLNAAATYRAEAPPAPPADLTRADFPSDSDYNRWLSDLRKLAKKERKAIEYLGYTSYFKSDSSYATAGVARLVQLAAWPTRGATSEATQDEANREVYVALALGLDLYAGRLTPSQTATVVAALKDRLQQVIEKLPALDTSPYQSHLVGSTRYLVYSLLSAAGVEGFPEAREWLERSWDAWVTTNGTWGSDGSFANSTAYGWWNGINLAETAAAVRLITGIDVSRWPDISGYGNTMIAFTAPAIDLSSPFGDSSETTTLYRAYSVDFYRLYAAVTRVPTYEWYWRATPSNVTTATPFTALHYLLLGLKQPAVTPVAPAANSWIFEDAGEVALHSNSADPNRSSLFFRSSRFGSDVHSTADNNAFVFVSKGKALFISGGYYPYYMSPHHALVGRATRYKNALTFDGGIGQAETSTAPTSPGKPTVSMEPRGQIVNFHDAGVWAVATGDATLAYRGQDQKSYAWTPLLTNAVRTVAYNRSEKVAVIYDWATSATSRTWELNFQMLNSPTVSGSTLRATNGSAQGCVNVYNAPGTFKVTKGFPIAPENGMPDQYQARYSVSRASTQLAAVTVIREDCRSVPVSVTFSATSASVAINGSAPLVMDKRTVTVP